MKTTAKSAPGNPGFAGTNPAYGIDPHDLTQRPANIPFDPQWITIVTISAPGPWQFTSNFASFAVENPANNTPATRLAHAVRILRKLAPGNAAPMRRLNTLRPGQPNAVPGIYQRPDGTYDREAFIDFSFGSQTEIFVYYDSNSIDLDITNLLSFSHFLSGQPPRRQAAPNDSFFVTAVKQPALGGPPLTGRLIRIENYNTRITHNGFALRNPAVQSEAVTYSLNLHFTVPGPRPLPMVMDPDTGNGYGGYP